MEEANAGRGLRVKPWMRGYITYVLPLIILALFSSASSVTFS